MNVGLLEEYQWEETEDACINVNGRLKGIKVLTGTDRIGEYRENPRIGKL